MTIQSEFSNAARKALGTSKQPASGATWLSIGGIIAGLGAASCCVVPFLLFAAGISGAWIGNLTAFEPYSPYFSVAALGALGFAGWRIFRPAAECKPGEVCAVPSVRRSYKVIFVVVAVLVALALAFPYYAPLFY